MPQDRGYTRWLPVILVVVGAMIYANALDAPFIFDSEGSIKGDERALSLSKALRESPVSMFTLSGDDPRPLVTISFALNHALGGIEPPGYQIFNIGVHVATAWALFALVRLTLLLPRWRERFASRADWWALAVALLWVVHPLNTQAVTYTVQRAESMMALFFLLAMVAAVRQWASPTRAGRWGWAVACVLAALLGSWCKQVIVVLPAVLLVYDWVMLARDRSGVEGERRYTLRDWARQRGALVAALAAVSVWLFARSFGIATDEASSAGFNLPVVTPFGYLMSQCSVILHYLQLSVWPDVLVLDYFWLPAIPNDTPPDMVGRLFLTRVLPFAVPMVLIFGASVYGAVRRHWWGFCGVAFFLILAPTSSVMPIADLAVEHRMYLPLTCVVALAVFGIGALLRVVAGEMELKIGAALVVVIAMSLGARTFIRNYDYASGITIWDKVILDKPNNPRGWQNLGALLLQEGEREQAMYCFERVISILPDYAAAHGGMGDIYLQEMRPDIAMEHYREAARIKPEVPGFHYDLGRALLMVGEFEESREHLLRAIELQPKYPKAYNNLGLGYLQQERFEEGIDALKTSIEQEPDQPDAYVNLALAYEKTGRLDEAIATMQRAVEVAEDADTTPEQLEAFRRRLEALRQGANSAPAVP